MNNRIYQKRLLIQDKWEEELNMEEALTHCFNFVRKTAKTWVKSESQVRLQFQNLIFGKNIEFDGERFGTPELSLIYKFNQEYHQEESKLVARRGIEPVGLI